MARQLMCFLVDLSRQLGRLLQQLGELNKLFQGRCRWSDQIFCHVGKDCTILVLPPLRPLPRFTTHNFMLQAHYDTMLASARGISCFPIAENWKSRTPFVNK